MSDSAISSFMNITGCDDNARAKFYIESANGDIDAAVIRYESYRMTHHINDSS